MSKINEATMSPSQYAAAVDNLKQIFHISKTVESTHEMINSGLLLHAHKSIMDLEAIRDDLMKEVYKMKSDRQEINLNLLKVYFSDVDGLVNELGKQLWFICSRALQAVYNDVGARQLGFALRIIEREHQTDVHYEKLNAMSTNSFKHPGRPREWKKQLFVVMKEVVRQRVEGSQFEDRTTNKQWLARYLEVCRNIMVDDLMVVKSGLELLFPSGYRIYDRMLKFYHDCTSDRIKEIASTGLEKNEIVQLLGWVNDYGGEQMLGHPRLGIKTDLFLQDNPLLPRSTIDKLLDKFIELTKRDLSSWMEKTISHENDEWYCNVPPEEGSNRLYYTQLPSILFGMVEDQVKLTKLISNELVPRFISLATDEFSVIAEKLKDATIAYRKKHFEDRAFLKFYTGTMIALANNMEICLESTNNLEKHIRLTIDSPLPIQVDRKELTDKINQLKQKWNLVMKTAILALLEEIDEDINKHIMRLMTKKWLLDNSDMKTVCATINDYHMDYSYLRPQIRFTVLKGILYRVVGEFIIAINSRRLIFSSYMERHLAAERLKADALEIERLFDALKIEKDCPFPPVIPVLSALAEILILRDKSLLSLEIGSFVRKYPDVHAELLSSLMSARDDVGRTEAKMIAEEALNQKLPHSNGNEEMLKLFQMCKFGEKRAVSAIEGIRTVFTEFMYHFDV